MLTKEQANNNYIKWRNDIASLRQFLTWYGMGGWAEDSSEAVKVSSAIAVALDELSVKLKAVDDLSIQLRGNIESN